MDVREEWQYYSQLFERFLKSHDKQLCNELKIAIERLNKTYKQEFQVNEIVIFSDEKYKIIAYDNRLKGYEIIRVRNENKAHSTFVHWASLKAIHGNEQLILNI